jgi:peptide/nickel transport system ATP-binding protein
MIDPPRAAALPSAAPDRFERCVENPPPLPIGERRRVRCWLYERETVA